jgi:hypothetical protein
MTRRTWIRIAFMGMTLGGAPLDVRAQNPADARVMNIDSECQPKLTKKASGNKDQPPSPRIGLDLFGGDKIRCAGPGYLELLLPDGLMRITRSEIMWITPSQTTKITPSKTQFTIKDGFTVPAVPTNSAFSEITKDLAKYGVPGATRGPQPVSGILWPSDGSAVIAEHFVIRWVPVAQKITISIKSEQSDTTLWRPTEIDGNVGSLRPEGVRWDLARDKSQAGNHQSVLTLSLAYGGHSEEVHFSLVGGQEEQEVNSSLSFWESHTSGLALHLGRGYSFLRHQLFDEAAAEYDTALNFAPNSRYLLEEAILANRLAGKRDRAKELQMHLESQSESIN